MYRLPLLILTLLLAVNFSSSPAANTPEGLLLKAEDLYQQQQFEKALETYHQVLETNAPKGPIYYNLGNVYYQLSKLGQAVRYYEKAHRLMPGDTRITRNLAVARQQVKEPIPQRPLPFWQRWWQAAIDLLGASGLFLLGVLAYLPAVGLTGYRVWSGGSLEMLRHLRNFLLGAALLGCSAGLTASWQQANSSQAVIIAPDTQLYQDPSTSSTAIRSVAEGITVEVLEDLSEWQQVQLPNGAVGWISKNQTGGI